jgi:hypothetical protein
MWRPIIALSTHNYQLPTATHSQSPTPKELRLTAIGVVIGLGASAVLVRSLARPLFGVPPLDPLTFVVAPLALTFVARLGVFDLTFDPCRLTFDLARHRLEPR